MFEKKKLLIKMVFEKAEKELGKTSKNSVSEYLNTLFDEKFGSSKHERTFSRYYKSLVTENTDYGIDPITLDHLSWFLNFKHFSDFCKNYNIVKEKGDTRIEFKIDDDENSLAERISKIIINITNTPVYNIPQIAKNGMGVGAMMIVLAGGLTYGGKISLKSECMFWDGKEYKVASCSDVNPNHQLLPVNDVKLKYFKKITRPDTLTIKNGLGNAWYSKCKNRVEFFTMDGINPDNGKSLREASEHMILKYAGENAEPMIEE